MNNLPGRGLRLIMVFSFAASAAFSVCQAQAAEPGLTFEGNTFFSSQRILRELTRLNVKTDAPLTRMEADDAAFFVREFYSEQGFPSAEVTYEWDAATGVASVQIGEGARLRLGEIGFQGQETFAVERLRDIVRAALRRASRRLVGTLYFSRSALEQAAEDVRRAYAAVGHLAAVVTWETMPGRHAGTEDVKFLIQEGPLFVLSQVTLDGDEQEAVPAEFFSEFIGKPYTPDEDVVLRERLLQHLRDAGFWAARLNVERRLNSETGAVHLDFLVETGERYRLGTITVTGTQKTNPAALRGLSGLKPGQLYDMSRLQNAERRIWFTGAFSKVDFLAQPGAQGEPVLDLELQVEEGRARQMRFSAGFNQWEMFNGSVEYSDRNFFGSLTRLDARLQASQKGYGAFSSLSDPFVLNTELEGTAGGYYLRNEWPGYRALFLGGVLGLRRKEPTANQTGYSAKFEYRSVQDVEVFGLPPEETADANYSVTALSWQQTQDRRNDPLMPMNGYLLHYDLALATRVLGGDVNFFRPQVHASLYRPLRNITPERTFVPFVFLNQRCGMIFPFSGTGNVPTPERFFLGGPNTVRSFQLDGMAPRDSDGDPIGGQFYWQFNAEVQVPLAGPLYAVGFLDFGNLALTVQDARINETRVAPGLGLRIYTPIGPVFLDYGYNLVRLDGDPIGAVQFGFGFTF